MRTFSLLIAALCVAAVSATTSGTTVQKPADKTAPKNGANVTEEAKKAPAAEATTETGAKANEDPKKAPAAEATTETGAKASDHSAEKLAASVKLNSKDADEIVAKAKKVRSAYVIKHESLMMEKNKKEKVVLNRSAEVGEGFKLWNSWNDKFMKAIEKKNSDSEKSAEDKTISERLRKIDIDEYNKYLAAHGQFVKISEQETAAALVKQVARQELHDTKNKFHVERRVLDAQYRVELANYKKADEKYLKALATLKKTKQESDIFYKRYEVQGHRTNFKIIQISNQERTVRHMEGNKEVHDQKAAADKQDLEHAKRKHADLVVMKADHDAAKPVSASATPEM